MNRTKKSRRRVSEHKLFKHQGNRIIEEVTDDDNTIDMMGKFNNDLDIKYELFCKWLQRNENGAQLCDEIGRRNFCNAASGPTLTEDEVSSFATNSDVDDDDSTKDIFLDTESEQPMIMVNGMLEMPHTDMTAVGTIDAMAFRANTPSQLSASDFDCSSTSDITVNSTGKINGKRKPKHKKGRAPPIPTAAAEINDNYAESDTIGSNLARETDI